MRIFIILIFLCSFLNLPAQDTTHFDQKKFNTYLIAAGCAYGITLIGLQTLWYSNSEQQSFHFFNDNSQWKQVDKVGHFYSSYQFSRISFDLLKKSGVPQKKSILWGSITGFMLISTIEVFDGFSVDYGASSGDLLANALGCGFLAGQLLLWDEIRIKPKFSFHQTPYAPLNPDLLGRNWRERLMKDYNGQTYWLSFDLAAFAKSDKKFMKWINIAVGYGAEDMLNARDESNKSLGYFPYRQFYLGIDPDLSHLKGRHKILNTFLYVLDGIKLPGPTLVFQKQELLFKPFYF